MQGMGSSEEDILASFREERLEQRKKKPAILTGIAIGVVSAVAIGWVTFGRYVSVYYGADKGSLTIIHADSTADGMKPESPGGMEIPNRDKLVYERLRKSDTELPVERLLPSVEKPVKPKTEEKKSEKADDDIIGALAMGIIKEEQQSSALLYEDDGTPVEVVFKEESPAVQKKSETQQKAKEEKKVTENVSSQVKPVSEKAPQPAGKKVEQKLSFMVQLVSARSESAAESEWKRLSKKYKEIIADQPHSVSKTVVSNGTFYRLRVGAFEKREDAAALCDQLKTQKQECFVVK